MYHRKQGNSIEKECLKNAYYNYERTKLIRFKKMVMISIRIVFS